MQETEVPMYLMDDDSFYLNPDNPNNGEFPWKVKLYGEKGVMRPGGPLSDYVIRLGVRRVSANELQEMYDKAERVKAELEYQQFAKLLRAHLNDKLPGLFLQNST